MRSISFIGCGKVGTTLAYILAKKNYRIDFVTDRVIAKCNAGLSFIGTGTASVQNEDALKSDIVLITVQDKFIEDVSRELSSPKRYSCENKIFIHTSGVLDNSSLAALKRKGAHTASMHPLQSFASAESAVGHIEGTYFFIEGDENAAGTAEELVRAMSGVPVRIETEKKQLYHTSAVMASNLTVALIDKAFRIMTESGVEKDIALPALLLLLSGTVTNIALYGTADALTGPAARGDLETVGKHLDAVKNDKEALEIYRILSISAVDIALRSGKLDAETAGKLKSLLNKREMC